MHTFIFSTRVWVKRNNSSPSESWEIEADLEWPLTWGIGLSGWHFWIWLFTYADYFRSTSSLGWAATWTEVLRLQSVFGPQLEQSANKSYTISTTTTSQGMMQMPYTLAQRKPTAECRMQSFQPALNCFSPSLITDSFITSFPAFKRKGHCVIITTKVFASLMNLPQLK